MSLDLPERQRKAWAADMSSSTIPVGARIAAFSSSGSAAVAQQYVSSARKTTRAVAFARDAVMAARAWGASSQEIAAWREFGSLYGLLSGLADVTDRRPAGRRDGTANGPYALLLAHAFAMAGEPRRKHLLLLDREAQLSYEARTTLHELLRSPPTVQSYMRSLRMLHDQAKSSLTSLCEPGPYAGLLSADLDTFFKQAHVQPREILGTP
jgi:hypothetical protein